MRSWVKGVYGEALSVSFLSSSRLSLALPDDRVHAQREDADMAVLWKGKEHGDSTIADEAGERAGIGNGIIFGDRLVIAFSHVKRNDLRRLARLLRRKEQD